jgi:hypothetical protein
MVIISGYGNKKTRTISMNCSGLLLLKYKKETFFNDLPFFAPACKTETGHGKK